MTGESVRSVGAIVPDAHLRTALAGIRGLGREGISVAALGPHRGAAGLWSRYAAFRTMATDRTDDSRALVAAVGRTAQERGPSVVYPSQETTIDALVRADALPAEAMSPYGSLDALRLLRDKRVLPALAGDAGLDAPAALVEATASELASTAVPMPCVVKPVKAGRLLATTEIVTSDDVLRRLLERLPHDEPLLVQERSRGGLSALAIVIDREGAVRARFQQAARRIWPPDAGVSSMAVSVAPDERLVERAAELLRRAGYSGLAQLQFIGGNGRRALIDVNTRFYGSLPLALACGVNLPAIWHRSLTGGPVSTPGPYRVGVSYRWLGGDVMAAANGAPRLLLDRAPSPRTGAIWSTDDPLPGVVSGLGAIATTVAKRSLRRRPDRDA